HDATPVSEQEHAPIATEIPDWRREVLVMLRSVRQLPGRLAAGWSQQRWPGRLELMLAMGLLVAFALSGHAAAVSANQFAYALAIDLLHLLAEATWLGGLLYIGLVFLPATKVLTPRQRARVMALGLPEFGAIAIVSATLLAATGSLNTAIRLTSISQF